MEKIDLTKRMIFLDSESFASIRANGLTLDDMSEIIFGTIDSMSVSKQRWEKKEYLGNKTVDNSNTDLYISELTEVAKKNIKRLLKISKNDLRYLISKNDLYCRMFNLKNYSWSLGYLLSSRWFEDKEAAAMEEIRLIPNYSVNIDALQNDFHSMDSLVSELYDNRGEREISFNNEKYLVHIGNKGMIVVLTSTVINNLITKDKNTLLYFYEDMLSNLSKTVDKKLIYNTDLYTNYLNA